MREVVALLVNTLYGIGIKNDSGCVDISTKTFTALDNHRRSFEYIIIELLGIVDAKLCRDRLMPFYPCHDAFRAREFRNAVYKWLTEFKRSGLLDNRALVRRSLLDDCAGERYEDLLFYLSAHAYRTSIKDKLFLEPLLRKWPALPEDANDLDIHSLYLIQAYRLSKLQAHRRQFKAEFKSVAMSLHLLTKSLSDSGKEASSIEKETFSQNQDLVASELSRLRNLVSKRHWLSALNDQNTSRNDSEHILPWKRRSAVSAPGRWAIAELGNRCDTSCERRKARLIALAEIPCVLDNNNVSKENAQKRSATLHFYPSQVRKVFKLRHQYGDKIISALESELGSLKRSCQSKLEQSTNNHVDISAKNMQVTTQKFKVESTPLWAPGVGKSWKPSITIPVPKRKEQDLLKTALKHNTFLFNNTAVAAEAPQTPQKWKSGDLPSSAKSIGRLIDILNEPQSTRSGSLSPSKPPAISRGGRVSEQSFSLWEYAE